MSTIYFKLNPILSNDLEKIMNKEGFENKSEFFRFLLKWYKKTSDYSDESFEETEDRLALALINLKKKKKKFLSVKAQLRNLS